MRVLLLWTVYGVLPVYVLVPLSLLQGAALRALQKSEQVPVFITSGLWLFPHPEALSSREAGAHQTV